jgi:iron uptake system component EfeO
MIISFVDRGGATAGALLLAGALQSCGAASPSTSVRASSGPSAVTIAVQLTDQGCQPDTFNLHPGTIIFSVTNSGSDKVKEMEIQDQQGHVRGDVEDVGPGETRSFVVDLKTGTYRVACPQTATHKGTLTIG